jgi:subtilisin family serine protease
VRLLEAQAPDALAALVRAAGLAMGDDAFVSPVFVGEGGGPVIPTRDVLVRFAPGVAPAAQRDALEASGMELLNETWAGMPGAYRLRSDARDGIEVVEQTMALAERAPMEFAEPDMLFTGSSGLVPSDFYFEDQWGMRNTGAFGGTPGVDINATLAWDITLGSPSVRVLVIDTGVDFEHQDLNVAGGQDFTNDPGANGGRPVNSFDDHGTPVAGCVAALLNDSGVVGVAPNVSIYSARPFISTNANGSWTAQSSWTVDALAWAESLGVRVTNNSNRYASVASGAITSMYQHTRDNGMVHFASGGNEFATQLTYPARLESVNGVAAVQNDGTRAGFSNQSNAIAFSGPGVEIITTDGSGNSGYIPGDWVVIDGTSFASPHAAGVAALMLSTRPNLTPDEVTWIMQSTALDLEAPGFDSETGWGMVRAYPAVIADVPSPGDFLRLIPAQNASARPRDTLTFGWQTPVFTSEYDLRIRLESTGEVVFEEVGLTATARILDLDLLEPGRRYLWEVVARNGHGATEASSGPSAFAVRPLGDVSGDCAVNFVDLNQVLAVFGQGGEFAEFADINGDGIVNFFELNTVLAEFGRSCD